MSWPRRRLRRYGFALVAILAAFAVRWLADGWLLNDYPRAFLGIAAFLVSAAWGIGPGIFALLVAAISGTWMFALPSAEAWLAVDWRSFFGFVTLGFAGIAGIEINRRSRARERGQLLTLEKSAEELRRAQDDARRSAETLRALLHAVGDSFTALDDQYRIIYINEQALRYVGKRSDEAVGRPLLEVFPKLVDSEFLKTVERVQTTRIAARMQTLSVYNRRWHETLVYPAVQGVALFARDVHEQVVTQRQLRDQEERLRLAIDAGRVGTWDWNIVENRVRWSERIFEFHGLHPGAFEGTVEAFTRTVHPGDVDRLRTAIQHALQDRKPYQIEMRIVRPSGEVRWVSTNGRVLYNDAGEPVRMLGATVDVTERRAAEDALRESEQRLRRLFNTNMIGMFRAKLDGHVLEANEEFLRIVGRTHQDIAEGKLNLHEITPADQIAVGKQAIGDLIATGAHRPFEKNYLRPGGLPVPVFEGTPLVDTAIAERVGFVIDLSTLKQAERELAQRETEFRALFELAAVGAAETDAAMQHFLRVNRRFCEMTGYSEPELLQTGVSQLLHPDDRRETLANSGGVLSPERTEMQVERRIVRKNGEVLHAIVNASVLRGPEGTPKRVLAHFMDISERRNYEDALRTAQQELRSYAERLEATVTDRTEALRVKIGELEAFSYSVSHDLRTPLRALSGYAQVLIEDYSASLDATAKSYLQRIASAAERLDRLTRDVLTYSRIGRGTTDLEAVSLEPILGDVIQHYPELQPGRADVFVRAPLLPVMAQPTGLMQCLSNLLVNAVKFVDKGVRPRVTLWTTQENDRVRIWVRDNGIGIEPEHTQRIFDLFERIHPDRTYDGTGIGLAIVKKAAERMGGSVGVLSTLGDGATFWLEFRAARAASLPRGPKDPSKEISRPGARR